MDENLEASDGSASEPLDNPWSVLENYDTSEQEKRPPRAEVDAALYIIGATENPTDEERAQYDELLDSGLTSRETYQNMRLMFIREIMDSNPDVYWGMRKHDNCEAQEFTRQFSERFSGEELGGFLDRFDAGEDCYEEFVGFVAHKLGISFADDIKVKKYEIADGTEPFGSMVWNHYNRDIRITEKTMNGFPNSEIMLSLMHELFHAKQTDISAETNRHVAEEMGFQYDENVHSRNVDNIHLENMAIRKLLAGELPDEYKRGALYNLNNAYYSYDKVWDEVRSTDDNEPFGFSPYYSQILEVEAYSFGAQVRERLLSARQPELRKTATEADRQKAEEVRKEAIARLFSPQDMLLVEDFINDPATDFRELDGIANYLTGSRRIEYLRRGAEMENDASGITIPDNANTKDPVFRRAYFRQCVKCGIDSRISDINTNVFMNAYEAGSEPETVIGDFFDMISLEMADNPRRGGDMALVALDATVNRDSYDSGAIFDQLDGITRRAKRSIKERMRYALNKRRFQKAHQSA